MNALLVAEGMMAPDQGTDTAPTLEAAVSSQAERATAAEARAEQAEDLAKRAEQALAVEQDRARQAEQERDPALRGFRRSWKQLDCSWPNSVP